jgi:glycosyltransferase involved in cell wall biosynthesis
MTVVSVQPFGLASPGGGPRILRALFADPPQRVLSVVTGVEASAPGDWDEVHVPLRPSLPTDGSRFNHWGDGVEVALAPAASRRLRGLLRSHGATVVHTVTHAPSFWPALQAARGLGLPVVLTVHDDLRYLLRHSPLRGTALRRLGAAWRDADVRIVIAEAMGREYAARYGERPFSIVTDGLRPADLHEPRVRGGLAVYFAGLFHRGYRDNLVRLLAALDLVAARTPAVNASFTARCGSLPGEFDAAVPVRALPFGPESVVGEDLARADLLYLPLMFGEEYRDMTDFSLSTKLVTYLGSGIPILYHGPPRGAAHEVLARHDAAILAPSMDPEDIATALAEAPRRAPAVVRNALALARSEFMLTEQRRRFWAAVDRCAGRAPAPARHG